MAKNVFVEIPARLLRVGDLLQGPHNSVVPIKSIELGRGCGNLHVNKSMCFDRVGFATVAE